MRRRRFQRGSIYPRKRSGKFYWYAQWRDQGIPRSKEFGLCSSMTRGQAEAILAEILAPINKMAGQKPCPYVNHTFGQFVDQVYLPVCRGKWKVSTAMSETERIRYHLVRPLNDRPLAAIQRAELQRLLESKARKVSRSVVSHLRFRLRAIFALAISEGVVDRNPATELYTPKRCAPGRERRVLSADNLAEIIRVLDFREHVVVRLATWEGMRPGEILGLQVGDLDLAGDYLWVRRRLYKGNIDVPKTERSARQVALSVGTIALLQMWVTELPNNHPGAWLFPNEKQKMPIRRDNLWQRYMLPKLEKVGLEWATFQVMRRTHATRAKEAGVDAHTRSAQMGNSVDVNENEYAVSDFKTRLAAVRKLETTLSK